MVGDEFVDGHKYTLNAGYLWTVLAVLVAVVSVVAVAGLCGELGCC